MIYHRLIWMSARVPKTVKSDWTGAAAHYWRLGVLDALKSVAMDHNISEMVEREAAIERIDRERRKHGRLHG